MEAVGTASSVIALIQLAGKASTAAISFMRDVKDARSDMIALRHELSALKTILEVLQEDIKMEPPQVGSMCKMHEQINGISRNCLQVVTEICQIIDTCRSRVGSTVASLEWVTSGKGKVTKLKRDLHIHTSSLEITLDMMAYFGIKEIKEDTAASRQGITELIEKADQILSMISWGHGPPREQFASAAMLGPYLAGLKDDAETILDSIDYQQEEEERTLGQNDLESDEQWRAPPPSAQVLPVTFINSQGRSFCIPFEACKTWPQMSNIIQDSFSTMDYIGTLENGKYDLIADGNIYLPNLWEMLVKPGLKIHMVMWNETVPTKADEPSDYCTRSPTANQTSTLTYQAQDPDPLMDRKAGILKFRDAVGRKYSFPWHLVNTWDGMKGLINQAFKSAGTMRDQVLAERYTLRVVETDEAIPKNKWATIVRPGMSVIMTMWPPLIRPLNVVSESPPPTLSQDPDFLPKWPVLEPKEIQLPPVIRVAGPPLPRHQVPLGLQTGQGTYETGGLTERQLAPSRARSKSPLHKLRTGHRSDNASSKPVHDGKVNLSSWSLLKYI